MKCCDHENFYVYGICTVLLPVHKRAWLQWLNTTFMCSLLFWSGILIKIIQSFCLFGYMCTCIIPMHYFMTLYQLDIPFSPHFHLFLELFQLQLMIDQRGACTCTCTCMYMYQGCNKCTSQLSEYPQAAFSIGKKQSDMAY